MRYESNVDIISCSIKDIRRWVLNIIYSLMYNAFIVAFREDFSIIFIVYLFIFYV